MKTKPISVFLCHSSGDKPTVRSLYARLRSDGISPWLDEEDLRPGDNWRTAISKAVRDADIVLVCLSKASIAKTGFVQKEITFALDRADEQPEGQIYVIPVRLEPCAVPQRLSQWQWVDLFSDGGYDKLLASLNLTRSHDVPTDSDTSSCWLLVAEIRGFTAFAEQMRSEDLDTLLAAWISSCKEIIENHNGKIDKYLGDGFLAYWREAETNPEEITAVIAALKELQQKNQPAFRVVLHFGPVAIGGVMEQESLMGREVNLVFRLEKLASSLGEPFCASDAAHTKLRGHIAAKALGEFEFKGFEGKCAFFAL
jgi:class 3 adenylate cyclase